MDTLTSFQKLMERHRPISAVKLNRLIAEQRLGMAEQYNWHVRTGSIKKSHNTNFLCQANTVILFFMHERIAIAAPRIILEGDTPMFPKTVLQKSVQIKYRCDITNDIEQGALLVTLTLPLDAFHVQTGDGQIKSLMDLLRLRGS